MYITEKDYAIKVTYQSSKLITRGSNKFDDGAINTILITKL